MKSLFIKIKGMLAAIMFFLIGFGSSMIMLHTYEYYVMTETDSLFIRGVAMIALLALNSYLLVHLFEDLLKLGEI